MSPPLRWSAAIALLGALGSAPACTPDFDGLSRGHDAGDPLPAHCTNSVLDEDESDLDCGGSCFGCDVDRSCRVANDCQTRTCMSGWCDLATGPPSWIATADVPTARLRAGAALGSDGLIYVIGGVEAIFAQTPTAVVEAYDPYFDQWRSRAPLPTPRWDISAATGADGQLYAVGGVDGSTSQSTSRVEAYDPAGNVWSPAPPLNLNRAGFALAQSEGGKIYVIEGVDPTNGGSALDTLEVYAGRPQTSWSVRQVPGTLHTSHSAVTMGADGRIFLLGGRSNDAAIATNAMRIYDPRSDEWSAGVDLPDPGLDAAAAQGGDGRIYRYNGHTVIAFRGRRWLPVGAPSGQTSFPKLVAGPDGRLYAIGGAAIGGGFFEGYGPILRQSAGAGATPDSVSVRGYNFAARATVRFYWDDSSTAAATTESDDAGAFAELPLSATGMRGAHSLAALDDRSRFRVRIPVVLGP